MKTRNIFAICLLALLTTSSILASQTLQTPENTTSQGYRITKDAAKTTIYLGDIEYNKTIVLKHWVVNNDTKPLVLKSLIADCGCSKVKWSQTPIPPNDSMEVEIRFTPLERDIFYKSIEFVPANSPYHKANNTLEVVLRGRAK